MKNSYFDLIERSHSFPQQGFDLRNDYLSFHDISLKYLIEKYGSPFRLFYLPHIGQQIKKARKLFKRAIKANKYAGSYHYCYCTKCCHFHHVVSEALKHKVNIETSSAFDIDLIRKMHQKGELENDITIVHNGYKTDEYLQKIIGLMNDGFANCMIVLDNKPELKRLLKISGDRTLNIGLRMSINEGPQSSRHSSRLGIRPTDLPIFFQTHIKNNEKLNLKMLHFFVDSGIKDSPYFWSQFQKAIKLYVELKKQADGLTALNLGGGFPIRNHLDFKYDYEYVIRKIVKNIKEACTAEYVQEPDIFTEFGKYTIGESGAIIFEVLEQKRQNDTELWYIINNSLMSTIPDTWLIREKFILLPINKWRNKYSEVRIGGISCDSLDFYNAEKANGKTMLPQFSPHEPEPLYVGFFHTGAYQDAIGGYGGVKHCLIPSPKHVIVDRNESGKLIDYIYRNEQSVDEMLRVLGYTD